MSKRKTDTRQQLKLLIVDDSLIIRQAIMKYLSEYDIHFVQPATNGTDALKKFKKYSPDIVTLDITMPGIDGFDVLQQMIEQKPATKIIVVTALNDKSTALRALRFGACDILIKPFDADRLRKKIDLIIFDSPKS